MHQIARRWRLDTLAPLTIAVNDGAASVEVAGAFWDPEGDRLTYGASSSAPTVAWVSVAGSTVTVTPVAIGPATVTVTATDAGGSSETATQTFRVTVAASNRPPAAVGRLAPLTIGVEDGAASVEVAGALRDPDGDRLTYGASSSAPAVAWVSVAGSKVTVTPVAVGTATVTVTATDAGGSNTTATQTFRVTVPPFTDYPIVPGVTPVKAVHFTELRTRIDAVRAAVALGPFPWTDPVLSAGVTRVRLVHLLELRSALGDAYRAAGRSAPVWTDAMLTAGTTPIRAAHLMELRDAVMTLITVNGSWSGTITGNFIVSDAVTAQLTQADTVVTGEWSSPMPAVLVAFGAPAHVNISGPVTGIATSTTAELSFGFLDTEVLRRYFPDGCALSVTVTSFTTMRMEGTWTTNALCLPPVIDSGTLTLTRQ